ncbi:GATA zinc finger domain-containing protein 14 [Calliphora vicina]|uniref:GATA zinc finger domain-containing protein 14 n=1 Tax=Calliphora vicina TaxID=7373 RepID=UPI00325AE045
MSSDSNREENQQSDDTAKNDKKPLTFKDWKMLKESQNKPNEKSQNSVTKTKNSKKSNGNARIDNINNYKNNGFNGPRGFNCQEVPNFFAGNYDMPGMNNFNNNNGMQNFNNNFGMRSNNNNFGPSNNVFNKPNDFGFNNFNVGNNYNNRSNNFGGNNFNNGFNNFNGPNNFGNGRNRFNGPSNGNNLDLPGNFFASDGIYRQKDLMQKPLPDINPFRNDWKAEQLLQEFDKSRYTKDYKNKKGNKNKAESKKSTSTSNNNNQRGQGNKLHNNEPKIYIPNPKAKIDGKPYIPIPKLPEENLNISKDEKKQQWKEYRDAMKPFKNREFYNAKRVVQRLGKLDPSELEEKQIIRLANAREIMANHKARLTEKYPKYVKADDDSNELGELFLLNRRYGKPVTKPLQNDGNFGESDDDFESGRKIVGGYMGFVPGGMLQHQDQRLSTY